MDAAAGFARPVKDLVERQRQPMEEDTMSTKMRMDSLANEEGLRTSERLHAELEDARGALEQARVRRDERQAGCEEVRMRLAAAQSSNAPPERVLELEFVCKKLELERDESWQHVLAAFKKAEDAARAFDARFVCGASSWLSDLAKRHGFDEELDRFVQQKRKEFDGMARRLEPLREIARRFDAAAEMLASWQLSGPGSLDSTCSGPQPKKMTFARVADFMRPVR